jgi:hypothetical protein
MCHPLMQPADMVVPLLEIPGINAKACINPINNISLIFLLREEFIFFSIFIFEAKNSSSEVKMKKRPISSILWVRALIELKNKYIGTSGAIATVKKIRIFLSLKIICDRRPLKKIIAAKVVPKLQTSSKIGEWRLFSILKKYLKNCRWAEELIGKNSQKPWTIPKIKACRLDTKASRLII